MFSPFLSLPISLKRWAWERRFYFFCVGGKYDWIGTSDY